MKKYLRVYDSYAFWSISAIRQLLTEACCAKYHCGEVDKLLNRSWTGIYIEWWLHSIGYYLTKPFVDKKQSMRELNKRFRHVDIEEHIKK